MMGSYTYMRCECSVCGKECLPLYTRGYGIDQVSFCSEECLKQQLDIRNLKSGERHICYECDKEFDAYGVSDHIGFTFCSTCSKCGKFFWHNGVRYSLDCACRYSGVAQHEVVTMDKEKEQEYEQRIKTLLEQIDNLQKMVYSLGADAESKEKEIKRIRSKIDLSTLEPLLDKLAALVTSLDLDGESVLDEMGENMAVLSILGLDELVSKLQDAIKATHDAGSELFDKIKELKEP